MEAITSGLTAIVLGLVAVAGALLAAAALASVAGRGPLPPLSRSLALAIACLGFGAVFIGIAGATRNPVAFWSAAASLVTAGAVLAWALARH